MKLNHEMLRIAIVATVSLGCQGAAEKSGDISSLTDVKAPDLAELAASYSAGPGESRIESAQRLVASSPREASSYLELAGAFLDTKRKTGKPVFLAYATDALKAAESLAPNDPAAIALRGVLLQEDHKFAELAELAESLIKADSRDATGYLLLGDAKLELGDYPAAASAYELAMERYPDLRVYSRGAHMRWLHGDIDGALEMMDAALESAGGNTEHLAWCLTDVGMLFLQRGELDRAVAAADAAEKLVADYPPASALRARAEFSRGNLDRAATALRSALKVRASASDYFVLADIEEQRRDKAASKRAAERGLALADHDPLPAATFLARRNQDIERAIELTANELAKRPTVIAHGASALVLARAGRTEDAAAAIEEALRLGTPLAELHLTGGLIKLAAGDVASARKALATATSINPHADRRLLKELRGKLEATE